MNPVKEEGMGITSLLVHILQDLIQLVCLCFVCTSVVCLSSKSYTIERIVVRLNKQVR